MGKPLRQGAFIPTSHRRAICYSRGERLTGDNSLIASGPEARASESLPPTFVQLKRSLRLVHFIAFSLQPPLLVIGYTQTSGANDSSYLPTTGTGQPNPLTRQLDLATFWNS
ncbi:hypothetical protein SCLCIDRAFT_346860 [Scleroderma citrinum Foug A]|uniref:Uncharacterized protein n=1 Tax=Scleroderma citrinum Foug A TaxID=1036808 RepID=A0A0C3D1Q8_9AGAM|nr:hypothetical protein SCLCIDRAFT_346860 [Scleroderma citrinum Foug A]